MKAAATWLGIGPVGGADGAPTTRPDLAVGGGAARALGLRHPIGGDHVMGMEPHRAVRIWVRIPAPSAPGATRSSVERQSVLCLGFAFDQRQSVEKNQIRLGNEKQKNVDCFGSPCKWLGIWLKKCNEFGHDPSEPQR